MTTTQPDPQFRGPVFHRRTTAIANANWFRALAWRALRDGSPQAQLRAANARAAARIVLRQARKDKAQLQLLEDAFALSA